MTRREDPPGSGWLRPTLPERRGHLCKYVGHRGQVEGPVGTCPERFVDALQAGLQLLECVRVRVVAGNVGTVLDDLGPSRAGVGDRLGHQVLEAVVGHLGTGHADHGKSRRQQAPPREVFQGGQQLAGGEVPGRAEDHQHPGRGPPDRSIPSARTLGGRGVSVTTGLPAFCSLALSSSAWSSSS